MSGRREYHIVVGAMAAAAALTPSVLSIMAAHDGALGNWALVAFALTAGILAGLVHVLARRDLATRYRLEHKPLAGPPPGARLPG